MSGLRHERPTTSGSTTGVASGPAPAQSPVPSGRPTPWDALREQLGSRLVQGEPVQRAGVTVVPVARVRAGAGGGGGEPGGSGSGGGGGGGGYVARPAGAWVITDTGAAWSPAVDVNRIVAGGQLLALVVTAVLALHAARPPCRPWPAPPTRRTALRVPFRPAAAAGSCTQGSRSQR